MNATNPFIFNKPNTSQFNNAFGTITSTQGCARRVQLGIKLIY